jgi:uncharacterized protein YcbK (DUF882 family)
VTRALAVVAALAGVAAAEPSKKDRAWAAKSAHRGAVPQPGAKPAKLINLYNSWTHEWLAVAPGTPPPQATIDRFLRDHYTNQPNRMEARLIEILIAAAQSFKSDTAHVVSAFRHPKYNLLLRKKGHQVARDSNHTKGVAVDFYIPNVPLFRLHAWAKQQAIGGVGLYPESQFIHMDTGPIRFWSGE